MFFIADSTGQTIKRPGIATSNQATPVTRRARMIRIFAALRSQGSDSTLVEPVLLAAMLRHLATTAAASERRTAALLFEEILAVRPEAHRPIERTNSNGSSSGSNASSAPDEMTRARRALERDLLWISANHTDTFDQLVTTVYQNFGNLVRGNAAILRAALSTMDFAQMMVFATAVQARDWLVFGSDAALFAIAGESLAWETFEQMCLWHIAAAELAPAQVDQFALRLVQSTLPSTLSPQEHAELFSGLQMLLRQSQPTPLTAALVFSLPTHAQPFAVACMLAWERSSSAGLAQACTAVALELATQLGSGGGSGGGGGGDGDDDDRSADVEDSFTAGQRKPSTLLSTALRVQPKQTALSLWRVVKQLCEQPPHEEVAHTALAKNIDFCYACRKLLLMMDMEADFNFSPLMSVVQAHEAERPPQEIPDKPSKSASRDADDDVVPARKGAVSRQKSTSKAPSGSPTQVRAKERVPASSKGVSRKARPSKRRAPARKSAKSDDDDDNNNGNDDDDDDEDISDEGSSGDDTDSDDVQNDDREFKPSAGRKRSLKQAAAVPEKPTVKQLPKRAATKPRRRDDLDEGETVSETFDSDDDEGDDNGRDGDNNGDNKDDDEDEDEQDDDDGGNGSRGLGANDDDDDYDEAGPSRRRKRAAGKPDAQATAKRARALGPASASPAASGASAAAPARKRKKPTLVESDSDSS